MAKVRQKKLAMRPEGPAAVGYLRVSTEEQAKSGLGLEAQRSEIEAAAKRLGLPLTAVHVDDGVGGSVEIEKRRALPMALGELMNRDVLLVKQRDRLARSVTELVLIERQVTRRGARIVSAAGEGTAGEEDSPTDQLMRRMIDAFAEFELSLIRSRTKAALRAKKARGERVGNIPFGKRAEGGALVDALDEMVVIRAVAEELQAGGTHREIVRRLRVRGIVSPRSKKPLALWQVQRLLKRLGESA